MAERFVVPLKPDNVGGGKGPQFKTDAIRGEEAFSRAKMKNRQRVDAAQRTGRLNVLLRSGVKRIGVSDVEIEQAGKRTIIRNDAVIVCAGGILPTSFLRSMGIDIETKYGTA